MSFIDFAKRVEESGLRARMCGPGHWQISGGKFLVNFYPDTKRGPVIYIDSTNKGISGGEDMAIKLANKLPKLEKVERKGSYKGQLDWLYRRGNICHVCGKKVEREDASLDHIIPISRGGLNNRNNYALAHKKCNHERGNQV